MCRRLFEIPLPFLGGYLPIYSYGVMLVIGFLAGIALGKARARKMGIDPDVITEIGMRAMIAGIVGARLFHVVENFRSYWPQVHKVLYIHEGGLVLYGGILTVLPVLAHYVRKQKLSVPKLFDVLALSLAIGLMFGRLGCFLNGCCFGDVCSPNMPFAVQFPKVMHRGQLEGSPAFLHHLDKGLVARDDDRSAPVHPTQLYSSACALGLLIFLNWYFPLRKRDGDVLLLLCLIYPLYRSVIEWLRADNEPWFTGLTTSQNISLVVFVVTLGLWLRRCSKLKAEGKNAAGDDENTGP